MNKHLRRIVVMLLALAAAVPAFGQQPRPDRPYRGLFGGSSNDPRSRQRLDLMASFYEGYDDNVLQEAQAGVRPDPRFQRSGSYGGGQVSLDYSRTGAHGGLDFSAGTDYRYYPGLKQLTGFNSWGTAGFDAKLGSRTTLHGSEGISYSPFYSFNPFPGLYTQSAGDIVVTTPDFSLLKERTTSYLSSASLDRRLTRRATGSIDYRFRYTDYQAIYQPLKESSVGGSYSYRLTTRAALRLGYHYRRGTYGRLSSATGARRPLISHDLDIGVDYDRPLSPSRRTKLSFSTGSSIVRRYETLAVTGDATSADATPGSNQFYRTHYLVTGNVGLSHQVGRSWSARIDYRRGLQYVEAFPAPFFSDSVAVTVGGFTGPRVRFNFSGGYSNGDVGITVTRRPYETYTGMAHTEVALKRWSALYADYFYYRYRFDASVVLPAGLSRGLDRNGIRGGVRLWLPLLR